MLDTLVEKNETIATIYERRAVRKFKDKPVDRSLIEQILDAGRMAPSAINKQPWKFHILTDQDLIAQFSRQTAKAAARGILKSGIKGVAKTISSFLHFSHGKDFLLSEDPIFHGAPVVIFLTSARSNEWACLDIGMCAQNMMLAAKSLGLESCPVGLGKFVEKTDLYPKLNIPDDEQVNLAVIFGYGDEQPELHERKKDNAFFH